MTIDSAPGKSRGKPIHRAVAGSCLAAGLTLLGGCGGGSSAPPDAVVTVTTTPTVTAGATASASPTATVTTTGEGTVNSDDVGRRFDLGTIVAVKHVGGESVIILDRWTARGVRDSTLAAEGVPLQAHSDAPFENLNTKVTYRVPVAPSATFTYSHCVTIDQPATQRSSTLAELARLQDSENVVLLSLDSRGRVARARNDPAC